MSAVSLPVQRPKGTALVRNSKYRHVFGTANQQTEWIMGLKLGASQTESTVVKANPKFVAIPWNSSGCVGVVNITQKGAINPEQPLIFHEENTVNDLEFHPFEHNLLVTATNSGAAVVWNIPDGGLTAELSVPLSSIQVSDKRLLTVDFHPLASEVMLTVDASKKVKLFDLGAQREKLEFPEVHKALVTNVSWNGAGSLVATAAKDKTLRVFDPRANSVAAETPDHDGAKGGRVLWMTKKDLIFTVGFSKGSDRQFALYDPRMLGKRMTLQKIDTASSTLLPFADQDNGLIFLGGKGDGNIRYYELADEEPFIHYLNEFKSKDPQSGLAALPKQSLDVMKCEIMRFIKLTPNGNVINVSFEVPRKDNHFFQEDIFPDTFDGKPSMTAEEWFSGANAPAGLMSLDPSKR